MNYYYIIIMIGINYCLYIYDFNQFQFQETFFQLLDIH